MRSNSKQVRQYMRDYILETVTDENENEFKTFDEAARELVRRFVVEFDHVNEQKRTPNHQERFSNWLQGGPLGFPVYNDQVINILNGSGINPQGKEYPHAKSWHLFHYMVWREVSTIYYELEN